MRKLILLALCMLPLPCFGQSNITVNQVQAATIKCVEGAAPNGLADYDVIYCDSTAHRVKVKLNNGSADTLAVFTDKLSSFASTTSAELAGVVSDETGSGALVLATSPAIATPTITGTTTTSGQIASTLATGTAPLSISSTTPVANLTLSNHPTLVACGDTTTCANTMLSSGRVIFGAAQLNGASPSQVVVSGISPAFASTTSYRCGISKAAGSATDLVSLAYTSTTSFTITGPNGNTDFVAYVCAGN